MLRIHLTNVVLTIT